MEVQGETNEKKNQRHRVKVAIRVRPPVIREIANNDNSCVRVEKGNQITLGTDKKYKFDQVFGEHSKQTQIYEECVRDLVSSCFDGYNAAILAYGQTGSGKTHTMGTSSSSQSNLQQGGILPRVIRHIFEQVENRKNKVEFVIKASFLQIYNQQFIDLLSDDLLIKTGNQNKIKDSSISIRQEKDGSVSIYGAIQPKVTKADQLLNLLQKGGFHRSTASTLMNDSSSRSHAIFTIFIEQHFIEDLYKDKPKKDDIIDQGFITAKFFFVDLAGSERAKKTGATGMTLKEGIKINLGLLELGNVISALATIEKKEDHFITYRNSKLTRILQDSLGGNSNTYMIACISPAQSNYEESLNTLKYASKAMNIKNKPVVNRDPQSAIVAQLQQRIYQIQQENRKLKHLMTQNGVKLEDSSMKSSRDLTSDELHKMKQMYISLQRKYEQQGKQLKEERKKINETIISNYQLKRESDLSKLELERIFKENPHLSRFNQEDFCTSKTVLQQYSARIQQLAANLTDKQNLYNQLHEEYQIINKMHEKDQKILIQKTKQIYNLVKQNKGLIKQRQQLKRNLELQLQGSLSSQKMILEEKSNIINHQQTTTRESALTIGGLTEILEEEIEEEQSEQIHTDSKYQELEQDFSRINEETYSELKSVDRYIEQKEESLRNLTDEQIELEYRLINEMKEQYHQKAIILERQKQNLINRKNQQVSVAQKNKLIGRVNNMEKQLKDYRQKMLDQKTMERQVSSQAKKISNLDQDIKRFRVQKIELTRKIKQDKTQFQKMKRERAKEILNAKKENMKQQCQIKNLIQQNTKKEMQMTKKQAQLKRAKKANQVLRSFANSHITRSRKQNKIKVNGPTIPNKELMGLQFTKLVEKAIKGVMLEVDRSTELNRYQDKMTKIQGQLDSLLHQQSLERLQVQRLRLNNDSDTEESKSTIQQLSINIQDLDERINNCEENYEFCKKNYEDLCTIKSLDFDLQTELIYNPSYNTIESFRNIAKATFEAIRNLLVENYRLREETENRHVLYTNLEEKYAQCREQIQQLNTEHRQNLAKLREQMLTKYYQSFEDQQQSQNLGNFRNGNPIQEKQRRSYERKIQDLTKANRQSTNEVEMWRRKCNLITEKYQSIRHLVEKGKYIGIQRQGNKQQQAAIYRDHKQKKHPFPHQNSRATANNQEIKQFLQTMNSHQIRTKKTLYEDSSQGGDNRETDLGAINEEPQFNKNQWECLGKIDAHSSPILSLATRQQFLISTATKSVKIWDLETNKLISEINSPHLQGFVKSVVIHPQKNYFATACDKLVTIWDFNSLKAEGVLKAHKEEIRTMHFANDYFFTAGKGVPNCGSLFAWDLSKQATPIDEKQRNQDIFSMTSSGKTLYYGTRNHQVRRMCMESMETLSPFEPPHMDTVTGLTILKDRLISGSKDKNLRLWSLNSSVNNIKSTIHVFNEYIQCLTSDSNLPIFYCGARDGQIKMGSVNQDKIHLLGGITSHTQSVNAISPIEHSTQSVIATASSDKTIRIWKPTRETMQHLESQYL